MYSFQGGELVALVLACMVVGMVGRWVVMGELPVIWSALKLLVGRRVKDTYSFRIGGLLRLVLEFVLIGIVVGWAFREGLWPIVKPLLQGVTQ